VKALKIRAALKAFMLSEAVPVDLHPIAQWTTGSIFWNSSSRFGANEIRLGDGGHDAKNTA
jgi:hypothetical protein